MRRRSLAGRRRRGGTRGGILALLAALACLAGLAVAELNSSPPGPVAPLPQATSPTRTATPKAGAAASRRERLAAVAWPAYGVSAADVGGFGVVAGPGATRPVPIASVAKVMTAYVILHDHPLTADGSGPDITVQPAEAAAYPSQVRDGDSLVPVTAGEVLTERQALQALLLPSADNIAWILARWDAGNQAAFTARMNATARQLGMADTDYTDPSGLARPPSAPRPTRYAWAGRRCGCPPWPRSRLSPRPTSRWPAWSATTTRCWARTGSPASRPAARRRPAAAFCSRPGTRRARAAP